MQEEKYLNPMCQRKVANSEQKINDGWQTQGENMKRIVELLT